MARRVTFFRLDLEPSVATSLKIFNANRVSCNRIDRKRWVRWRKETSERREEFQHVCVGKRVCR